MDISGNWYNELGSTMNITDGGNGTFTLTYLSGVGPTDTFYGAGAYDNSSDTDEAIGFVVIWSIQPDNPSPAVTSWSGQIQIDEGSNQVMVTTWLLTVDTDASENWNSTKSEMRIRIILR